MLRRSRRSRSTTSAPRLARPRSPASGARSPSWSPRTSRSRSSSSATTTRWVDQILPQALGLTQHGRLPSIVVVLVCRLPHRSARSTPGATREAVLAGTSPASRSALKPSNALFLAGAARRLRARAPVARTRRSSRSRSLPALLALTIWKYRGLGSAAALRAERGDRLAAGLGDPDPRRRPRAGSTVRPPRLATPGARTSSTSASTPGARAWSVPPARRSARASPRSVARGRAFLTWLLGYVVIKGAAGRRDGRVAAASGGSSCPALARVRAASRCRRRCSSRPSSTGSGRGSTPPRRADPALTAARRCRRRSSPVVPSPSSCSRHQSRRADRDGGVRLRPSSSWTRSACRSTGRRLAHRPPRRDANVLPGPTRTTRARTFYRVYRARRRAASRT